MDWSALSVWGDIAQAHAAAHAGKVAFISGGRAFTFGQANDRMNRLNNALAGLGLAKGDRVAILSRNRPEYVEAYGVAKSGMIAVPLNWRLSSRELFHLLKDSRPSVVLAEPEFTPILDGLRLDLEGVRRFVTFGPAKAGWLAYEALLAGASGGEPRADVRSDDPLCLMYTSGTTGAPKGAVLTHGGLIRNCRVAAETMLRLGPEDVALAVMPLFHVGGMWYHLFPSYARGCTTVILAESEPRSVLAALQDHGVTNVHLVPTVIHALVNQPDVREFDLGRLRVIYYAASSISVDLLRQAIARFGRSGFLQSYGTTEVGIVTALTPEDHETAIRDPAREGRLASCGWPLGRNDVRILDDHGGAAAPGMVGEIVVRNDRGMAGYWQGPGAVRQAAVDGWLTTGDLGRVDEDGCLYIVDRKHDMIVSGGENVYPGEVEAVLCRDPDVLEVAVFGIPDPRWVEQVAAAVVLKPGCAATADDVIRRARRQLAAYKCPKTVMFTDSLPKSATGKVLKKELRRQYGNG
jgi:acyl-CoA synthetase (AMP-forming)/AMP-acid ligase II